MNVFPTPPDEIFFRMVKVLFYGLKIIGLAPLSILFKTRARNTRNTCIKVVLFSKMGLLYNIALAILIEIICGLGVSAVISIEYPGESHFSQILDLVERIIYSFTSSFIITYLAFRQKTAAIILNRLSDVNFLLSGAKEQLFNKRMHIFLSLQMAFDVFIWTMCWSTNFVNGSFLVIILPVTSNFIIHFFLIEYSIILGVLAREFEMLNQNLLNLRDFPNYSFRTSTLPNKNLSMLSLSTRNKLTTLKLLHSVRTTLFELSQDIADFFSFPMLLTTACNFLTLIYALYFVITAAFISNSRVSMLHNINNVTWILIISSPLVLVAFNATETAKKAKLTGLIIHKLLATAKTEEIQMELKHFSLHLIHEDISFTGYGFFQIDFRLLQSILGATATYLIIIIQFVRSAERDENKSN